MLKSKSVKGKKLAPADDAAGAKKKKKNVKEIDGVTWLLDDDGNPLKKVRKKGAKESDEKAGGTRGRSPVPPESPGGTGAKKKAKKNVVEIDGQLFLLDENGKPSKKIRRKGDKPVRSNSQGPLGGRGRGRTAVQMVNERRRARSLNRTKPGDPPNFEPKEYIDDKGRKVIIEADGTKIVIDKNGKRLRPKKKKNELPAAPKPAASTPKKSMNEDDSVLFGDNENMFDQLWGDEDADSPMKGSPDKAAKKGGSSPVEASSNKETTSLSEKISALGKENRELSLKLQAAEEHAHDLFEQNKREKGKNVKAMTDMMQLKADYAESSSEVQKLKARINDVTSSLDTKEQEIAKLREAVDSAAAQAASQEESIPRDHGRKKHGSSGGGGAPCPTCGSESKEVEELFAENRSLQRKMEFERSNAQQASKKQEDKIVFMTKELTTIREEMEQILRGEVGNLAVNPTFVRLLDERKKLASELEQQKEIYEIRLQSMEESISSLQQVNRDLKKQLRDNGITPDEQNIDLVTGLPMGPVGGKIEEKRDTGKKHIGEINVNFNKSIGDSKGWFAFVNK